METPLTFEYDEVGDILYISKVPPLSGAGDRAVGLQRRGTPESPDQCRGEPRDPLLHPLVAQRRQAAVPWPGRAVRGTGRGRSRVAAHRRPAASGFATRKTPFLTRIPFPAGSIPEAPGPSARSKPLQGGSHGGASRRGGSWGIRGIQNRHGNLDTTLRREILRLLVTPFQAIPTQDCSIGGTHRCYDTSDSGPASEAMKKRTPTSRAFVETSPAAVRDLAGTTAVGASPQASDD